MGFGYGVCLGCGFGYFVGGYCLCWFGGWLEGGVDDDGLVGFEVCVVVDFVLLCYLMGIDFVVCCDVGDCVGFVGFEVYVV